ncbi:MAG: DegT/DnrJ/EryC1/StrS family aminotransferase [Acidobacteriota bacterium]|nr:DegT/DnrJ/EryC1/StrS family aminotransferase [Acidobacteriota bacterium]
MEVPLTDLKAQYQILRADLLKAVDDALTSMQLTLGPNVQAFEREFAEYCQAPHAVGVGNGTEAIALALQAAGVGPGDEVITVSWTFIASIEAIVHAGATPVVVDIDRDTYTMDPESLAQAITPRTKAVIPVHVFGHPADMDAIRALAEPRGIAVIEDAAQAHGATYKGRKAGSLGDAATFSFYLTKNLGGYGEGGIVTTVSDEIFDRLTLLRNHGHRSKYEHEIVGYNGRLDELQAAMLRVKLPYLDQWNEARRACAAMYTERLADLPVEPPREADWAKHVYHLYTIRTEKRDALSEAFAEARIGHTLHYKVPPHTQPACAKYGLNDANLPVTAELSSRVIQLPMHPYLKEEEIDYVCDVIRKVVA